MQLKYNKIYRCIQSDSNLLLYKRHKLEKVKLMIELGFNINTEDKYRQTCFFTL